MRRPTRGGGVVAEIRASMNPVNEFVTASCTDWSNMDLKPATPGPTDGDGVVVPGVVVELP